MKTKWLTYTRQNAIYYMGLEAFSAWLPEIAAVQEDVLLTGNPNADKSKWASKDKPKNSTFSTFADDSADKKTGHDCPLKDGKHPLWKCEKFLKMTSQARYEKAKELKLCFCCLAGKHVVKSCTYKACGVKSCSRRHHRLLHREANERRKSSGRPTTESGGKFSILLTEEQWNSASYTCHHSNWQKARINVGSV